MSLNFVWELKITMYETRGYWRLLALISQLHATKLDRFQIRLHAGGPVAISIGCIQLLFIYLHIPYPFRMLFVQCHYSINIIHSFSIPTHQGRLK